MEGVKSYIDRCRCCRIISYTCNEWFDKSPTATHPQTKIIANQMCGLDKSCSETKLGFRLSSHVIWLQRRNSDPRVIYRVTRYRVCMFAFTGTATTASNMVFLKSYSSSSCCKEQPQLLRSYSIHESSTQKLRSGLPVAERGA